MRRWFFLLLWAASAWAQEDPHPFEKNLQTFEPITLPDGGRHRIAFTLHRWGDRRGEESFTLSVVAQPAFVKEARWSETKVAMGPDDDEKELTITVVVEGRGEGDLVVLVRADDEDVFPRSRRFVFPLRHTGAAAAEAEAGGGGVHVAAVAEGVEKFELADAHEHVDRTARPLTLLDDVVVFFDPGIEKPHFYVFVRRADGSGPWWRRVGDDGAGGRFLNVARAKEGAPAPYVARFKPHTAFFRASRAGEHRLLVAAVAGSTGLLGSAGFEPGEKVLRGTFALEAPLLHLQGVLVERGAGLPVEFSAPRGGGGRYMLAVTAGGARSVLALEVPATIDLRGGDRKDLQGMPGPGTAERLAKGFVYGEVRASLSGGWGVNVSSLVPSRGGIERARLRYGWGKSKRQDDAFELRTGGRSAGKPSRGLAWHYRDPDTRWYVPVRVGRGPAVAYAYAVYKPAPGNDVGPAPIVPAPAEPTVNTDPDGTSDTGDHRDASGPKPSGADSGGVESSRRSRVPVVRGRTRDEVREILKARGLRPEFVTGPVAPTPDLVGRVRGTVPAANEAVAKGTAVRVVVYGARRAARVPKVTGEKHLTALLRLRQAGLKAKIREGAPARTLFQQGTVYEQQPPPGTEVRPGDTVHLVMYSAMSRDAEPAGPELRVGPVRASRSVRPGETITFEAPFRIEGVDSSQHVRVRWSTDGQPRWRFEETRAARPATLRYVLRVPADARPGRYRTQVECRTRDPGGGSVTRLASFTWTILKPTATKPKPKPEPRPEPKPEPKPQRAGVWVREEIDTKLPRNTRGAGGSFRRWFHSGTKGGYELRSVAGGRVTDHWRCEMAYQVPPARLTPGQVFTLATSGSVRSLIQPTGDYVYCQVQYGGFPEAAFRRYELVRCRVTRANVRAQRRESFEVAARPPDVFEFQAWISDSRNKIVRRWRYRRAGGAARSEPAERAPGAGWKLIGPPKVEWPEPGKPNPRANEIDRRVWSGDVGRFRCHLTRRQRATGAVVRDFVFDVTHGRMPSELRPGQSVSIWVRARCEVRVQRRGSDFIEGYFEAQGLSMRGYISARKRRQAFFKADPGKPTDSLTVTFRAPSRPNKKELKLVLQIRGRPTVTWTYRLSD